MHPKISSTRVKDSLLEVCDGATTNAREDRELTLTDEERSYAVLALLHTRGGCFGISKEGYYGMYPPQAATGDEVFMIEGGVKTFLIRWQPDSDSCEWLGEVFIYKFEEQIEKAIATSLPATISVI